MFLVFAGYHYYPSGGWDDFAGRCDTLAEARQIAEKTDGDWWQIVDLAMGTVVEQS